MHACIEASSQALYCSRLATPSGDSGRIFSDGPHALQAHTCQACTMQDAHRATLQMKKRKKVDLGRQAVRQQGSGQEAAKGGHRGFQRVARAHPGWKDSAKDSF